MFTVEAVFPGIVNERNFFSLPGKGCISQMGLAPLLRKIQGDFGGSKPSVSFLASKVSTPSSLARALILVKRHGRAEHVEGFATLHFLMSDVLLRNTFSFPTQDKGVFKLCY